MSGRLASGILLTLLLTIATGDVSPQQRTKFRGYVTQAPSENSFKILEDVIVFDQGTRLEHENAAPGKTPTIKDLDFGVLVEVEGPWQARHQLRAEKIKCDWSESRQEAEERVFVDNALPPLPPAALESGLRFNADGEVLALGIGTRVMGGTQVIPASAQGRTPGRQIRYRGVRQQDGTITVNELELGSPRPADAFDMDGMKVVRAKDSKTDIDILEFRKGKNVLGRVKLFPVKQVQDYVAGLGEKLVPLGLREAAPGGLEFRFYVVEDANINAMALPDGTVLVNTGLLAAIENEAQLAFVLGHEINHASQAHYWRHVHETRGKRILLTLARAAAAYYIGDVGVFLADLGLIAVVNGYARRLENQADRLGLETLIAHGYDPRQASRLSQMMIARYGDRATSALWSNHDSSVLRGSFLTVQVVRRFPGQDFSQATVNTEAFRSARDAMGPVKIR